MIEIKVKNYLGKILDFQATNDYTITSVEGLSPSMGIINTSKLAKVDGSFYNSGRVEQRNIVITIVPNNNIENNRLYLYEFFKPNKKVTMYFKTNQRNVYIEGYVESFEGSLYTQRQSFQASIICPQPYFSDMQAKTFTQATHKNTFTFPFSIPEEGITFSELSEIKDCNVLNLGVASGLIIELIASNTVRNPKIFNRTMREKIELNYTMKSGDVIQIDTRTGNKGIILIRNGISQNILFSLLKGSKWLSVESGENLFTFSSDYGNNNLQVTYKFYTLHEGV
ncbi:MAG: phage tail family protein [Lachnospiraceae bacterium]|nr:phage tail family protein [Lachnospiraceae bacterium]